MKTHLKVTAESGISRGKSALLRQPHVPLWKLCGNYHHSLQCRITSSYFTLSKVPRAGASCICKHLKALWGCGAGYAVLNKPGDEAAWSRALRFRGSCDPAPKAQPTRSCPEYRVGPCHWLCQLKLQKGPQHWCIFSSTLQEPWKSGCTGRAHHTESIVLNLGMGCPCHQFHLHAASVLVGLLTTFPR